MASQVAKITSNPSRGYSPSSFSWYGLASHVLDGTPVFTWLDIPRMTRDPQVLFLLRMLRAPFGQVKWKVKSNADAVARWVDTTLSKIWRRDVPKILHRYFQWGFAGAGVEWEIKRGKYQVSLLRTLEATDARPLVRNGGRTANDFCGIQIPVVSGTSKIGAPHAFWFAGHAELTPFYDRPRLAGMYEPWLEKRGRTGAIHSRRLWYAKCAFDGGVMRHPSGLANVGTDEVPVYRHNQDLAREIIEYASNGGAFTFSNEKHPDGSGYLWEYDPPKSRPDVAGVRDYPKDLDREMAVGAGIPPEVYEAAETGSGWSGRKIPALAYFGSCDELVGMILESIVRFVLRPGVQLNFGKRFDFDIEPTPLAEILLADGKPNEPGTTPQNGVQPGQGGPGGRIAPPSRPNPAVDPNQYADLSQAAPGTADPVDPPARLTDRAVRRADRDARARRLLLLAMLDTQAEATEKGNPDAAAEELANLASLADDPRELLAIARGQANLSWAAHGQSRSGKPRWKNTETGEIRYQKTAPGERTAQRQASQASGKRAMQLASLADRGEATAEHLSELADHLPALTVEHLRAVRLQVGAKFESAARRDAMVTALRNYVRGVSPAAPTTPALPPAAGDDANDGKPPAEPKRGKVYHVNTDELHVDPERFQFKLNATLPGGVTDELKDVKKFNPEFAGVVSAWRDPADGKSYVVNGHHRRELAGRHGQKDLAVRYIEAPNAQYARAVGALINIAEGRGTSVDAAKFMRDTGTTVDQLDSEHGVSLRGAVAKDAVQLTKLADPLFNRVTRGTLDTARALAVASQIPDHDQQAAFVNYLEKQEERTDKEYTPKIVAEAAAEWSSTPTRQKTEATLFGDEVSNESLYLDRAELKQYVKEQLARELRDYTAVGNDRRADAVSGAGNVLNVEENRKRALQVESQLAKFKSAGGWSDILNEEAGKHAEATGKRARDEVKRRTLERVRSALSEVEAGGARRDDGTGQGAPRTDDSQGRGDEVGDKSGVR